MSTSDVTTPSDMTSDAPGVEEHILLHKNILVVTQQKMIVYIAIVIMSQMTTHSLIVTKLVT